MTRLADITLPDGMAFANAGRVARGQKLKVHIAETDRDHGHISQAALCGTRPSSHLYNTSPDTLRFKTLDDVCPRCEAKLDAPLAEPAPEFPNAASAIIDNLGRYGFFAVYDPTGGYDMYLDRVESLLTVVADKSAWLWVVAELTHAERRLRNVKGATAEVESLAEVIIRRHFHHSTLPITAGPVWLLRRALMGDYERSGESGLIEFSNVGDIATMVRVAQGLNDGEFFDADALAEFEVEEAPGG